MHDCWVARIVRATTMLFKQTSSRSSPLIEVEAFGTYGIYRTPYFSKGIRRKNVLPIVSDWLSGFNARTCSSSVPPAVITHDMAHRRSASRSGQFQNLPNVDATPSAVAWSQVHVRVAVQHILILADVTLPPPPPPNTLCACTRVPPSATK